VPEFSSKEKVFLVNLFLCFPRRLNKKKKRKSHKSRAEFFIYASQSRKCKSVMSRADEEEEEATKFSQLSEAKINHFALKVNQKNCFLLLLPGSAVPLNRAERMERRNIA
jgi:hypothetical protein